MGIITFSYTDPISDIAIINRILEDKNVSVLVWVAGVKLFGYCLAIYYSK